eukprot:TRINITY_DN4067_c0_g1_i3.p1 TRINITY_DN4067_c0_g1~~TRINITY_DN4067_c0_g1_i3.p1  ORF type:complete len:239 (-),score=61.36 TRINITY_DN4067_c0_g1_i3:93-809(-)
MMRGFSDLVTQAGSRVTGGQTVINAWPLIGGVAMACAQEQDFVRPDGAVAGDVLVLTKPLGTQVAVNAHQWINPVNAGHGKFWHRVSPFFTEKEAIVAYNKAGISMSRLNLTAAKLMHKYKAHGATDVTGFGLMGHANNLAIHQKNEVNFILKVLPLIKGMKSLDDEVQIFKLLQGLSAETSGGLLVCLPSHEVAVEFCKEIEEIDGYPAWIIGEVVERSEGEANCAKLVDQPTILEI